MTVEFPKWAALALLVCSLVVNVAMPICAAIAIARMGAEGRWARIAETAFDWAFGVLVIALVLAGALSIHFFK